MAVLVVDDNRDYAESLADILRAFGHDVQTSYTSTEALFAVETFAPDAILIDIGLPGLDGYCLARKLCERLDRRPLLVAITGFANLDDKSRLEGFDHHFLKPVDPRKLVNVLGADRNRCAGVEAVAIQRN